MRRTSPSVEAMVRNAFDLLLQLRNQPQAETLLPQALAFLQILAQQPHAQINPLVISVRAVRIRGT